MIELLELMESGYVSSNNARDVFVMMMEGDGRSPKQIIDEKGLSQNSDDKLLHQLCSDVLSKYPKEVFIHSHYGIYAVFYFGKKVVAHALLATSLVAFVLPALFYQCCFFALLNVGLKYDFWVNSTLKLFQ